MRATHIEKLGAPPVLVAVEAPELAGACGTAGCSGWLPVVWRAKTTPDDRVLVLGATGTVGLASVQAARIVGAQRIVAVGRRQEGLELAADLGAHAVVNLNEG